MGLLHLHHDGSLTCTHSIAESVSAVAAEAARRGADYVRLTFDATKCVVQECYELTYRERGRGTSAMARALGAHDPFQSGEHPTLPAWYVGHQLAYALGAESIVLN